MRALYKRSMLMVSLSGILTCSSVSFASGVETAATSQQRQQEIAEQTVNKLFNIASGLKNYYVHNSGAWPASLEAISSSYVGDFTTPLGNVTGSGTTTAYALYVALPNIDDNQRAILKGELSKNNAAIVGGRIVYNVNAPQAAAIAKSSLSRFSDPSGSGELNTMYTDLLMGGHNIRAVNELQAKNVVSDEATVGTLTSTQLSAQQANLVNANITTANITTAKINEGNVKNLISDSATIETGKVTNFTSTQASIDSANINAAIVAQANIDKLDAVNASLVTLSANSANLNAANVSGSLIANALTVKGPSHFKSDVFINGVRLISSDSKLYYQGKDIDLKYLGINDTATNSNNLGGVAAANYARKDLNNQFTTHQTFNNGITVNGSGVQTTNVNASGNVVASNVYIRSRNTWLSQAVDNINSNANRIRVLEDKVNSSNGSIWWGRSVQTHYAKTFYQQQHPSWIAEIKRSNIGRYMLGGPTCLGPAKWYTSKIVSHSPTTWEHRGWECRQ